MNTPEEMSAVRPWFAASLPALVALSIGTVGTVSPARAEPNGTADPHDAILNAAPDRDLVVTVRRVAGRCEAQARTSIAGIDAQLRWVYVRFAWPLGVDYVLLHGARPTDGAPVEERL